MPSLYDPLPTANGKPRRTPIWRPILSVIGVFCLSFMALSAPVAIAQIKYVLSKPKPVTSVAALQQMTETPGAASVITIPKISLKAPVQYEPSTAEAAVQRALQDGVVHYGNTAVPGTTGNVAIFGHSSNDWWQAGNYKFVFVLLDKLVPGDRITMDYQSKRYVYEVTGSRVVEPTNVSVLNPTAVPTLTLITCTPAGTSLRRLVVSARQISPDPKGAVVVATAVQKIGAGQPVTKLTDTRGFTSGIWNVFTNVMNWFWPPSRQKTS